MGGIKSQRLFFALWPDPEVRALLAETGASLCLRGRPTHEQDLHITLVFLGQVEPERMAAVQAAASTVSCTPFRLTLDLLDCWRRPGIVWCGPTEIPQALSQLALDLNRAMGECGFPPERRPYKPHVTLARKARLKERLLLEKPIAWRVKEFVLVCSDTGGEPPHYRVLKKWSMDS